MTPKQIGLVGVTWDKVVPISETAAELFYGKLFELDPHRTMIGSHYLVQDEGIIH